MLDDVRKQLTQTVSRGSVVMQGTMQQMLSQPGSGRIYVRTKAGRKRAKGMSVFGAALKASMEAAARGKVKSLRALGFHQASAPGEPPAVDTGTLRRAVQIDDSELRGKQVIRNRIGTALPYAKWLEFGTARMAPRPWARPSLVKVEPTFVEEVRRTVAAITKKYGGK